MASTRSHTDDWEDPDTVKTYRAAAEVLSGHCALHLIWQCNLDRANESSDHVVLDNACGTGVFTLNLYQTLSPAAEAKLQVVCGDLSHWMVNSVQERIEENGWAGASTMILDAESMDLPSNHFTHVITNFALPFFAEPRSFLAESYRVLRPSGMTALTRLANVAWYPIAAAAVVRISGAPRPLSFEEFCRDVLRERKGDDHWTDMREVGFEDVRSVLQKVVVMERNADEYVETYCGMLVSGSAWTEEERERVRPHFEAALREEVKDRYGDAEIPLD